MGCHFLLQCMKVNSENEATQLCPTLSDPMDCNPPGSSIHGVPQARVLEWAAIAFSLEDEWNMNFSPSLSTSQNLNCSFPRFWSYCYPYDHKIGVPLTTCYHFFPIISYSAEVKCRRDKSIFTKVIEIHYISHHDGRGLLQGDLVSSLFNQMVIIFIGQRLANFSYKWPKRNIFSSVGELL